MLPALPAVDIKSFASALSPIVAMVSAAVTNTAAQAIPVWVNMTTVYLRGAAVLVGSADAAVCYVCVQSCTSGTTASSGTAPGTQTTVGTGASTTALDGGKWGATGGSSSYTTADGAIWIPVTSFPNGIAIANTNTASSGNLIVGRDPNITATSTGITTIPAQGSLVLNGSWTPSQIYVYAASSTAYSLVGQA